MGLWINWRVGSGVFFFFFLINWKIEEHDNMLMGVIQQRGKVLKLDQGNN